MKAYKVELLMSVVGVVLLNIGFMFGREYAVPPEKEFKLTQQELIEQGYAYYHPVTGEFKLAPNQPQVVYQQGLRAADHLEKRPTISKGGSY